jgi:hypothetical protein
MGAVAVCGPWARGDVKPIVESARNLPVCQTAEVVVVGGSWCGRRRQAPLRREQGFLIEPSPYVGDDLGDDASLAGGGRDAGIAGSQRRFSSDR